MLEFDGQALDPAIVSAQPMKSVQNVDLQQMGCPSSQWQLIYFHSEQIIWQILLIRVWSLLFNVDILTYERNTPVVICEVLLFFIFFQTAHAESRLPQTGVVSGPQESSQVSTVIEHQDAVSGTWLF